MTDLAPIILFVYNRPKHTETVINALKKNTLAAESILYVFSDAAKKEKERRGSALSPGGRDQSWTAHSPFLKMGVG